MNPLQPWVTALIALCLVFGLFANITADVFVRDYQGYSTTLVIAGLLGGVLGIDRYLRKGRGE